MRTTLLQLYLWASKPAMSAMRAWSEIVSSPENVTDGTSDNETMEAPKQIYKYEFQDQGIFDVTT